MSHGHTNSHATRDGITKWGGAIIWNGWAVGFSGLPELGDECVSAYVMVESGWATWKDIETIIGMHNPFLKPFREAVYS